MGKQLQQQKQQWHSKSILYTHLWKKKRKKKNNKIRSHYILRLTSHH